MHNEVNAAIAASKAKLGREDHQFVYGWLESKLIELEKQLKASRAYAEGLQEQLDAVTSAVTPEALEGVRGFRGGPS